ncbi:MAG: carbon-nitrogen hydrolase family protein [Lachnospiraceae bacterium]|nr:carbon-nitrogen hydrolase family protein [Lachnospiraceae bacterium]
MKLALAQMKNEGDKQKNLSKSLTLIEEAANSGADLILFPEVQLTEFFPQYKGRDVSAYRISLDSEEVKAFQEASRRAGIISVPNIYLEEQGKAYDASLLIDQQGILQGIQKMIHVAQAEQFYEQDYYTPGDDGFKVFDTPFGRIGIVVCFDRHYPESIRTEALMDADLILIPTVNTKTEPSEVFEWELRIQAFQNSVAVAMCNRVGSEGEMDFSGESIVVDANGAVVAKADDQEQILYVEVDLSQSKKIRDSRPYTQLRRKEFYR